jgi:hypothetical protein
MTGGNGAILAILQSHTTKLFANVLDHRAGTPEESAIMLLGARDFTMDAGAFVDPSWSGTDSGRNTVYAHEAVHVMQSGRVKVAGVDVEAPEQPATASATAILVEGSTDVTAGSLESGNNLLLNGGNGIVLKNSRGTASGTTVSGANDAIRLEASELQMRMMQLQESQRALNAILQSRAEVHQSIIRNMRSSNSGIHMENSTGSITGTTITGDAGDAVWLDGSDPTINGNNFEGNTGFGIRNVDPTIVVDATGNWWGDASGPGGEGAGSGDEVSERVDFGGWLSSKVGLLVSTDADTITVVPGANVTIDAAVQNLVNPSDQADIEVGDVAAWLTSQASFSVTTNTDPEPFSVTLQVPIDAPNGSSSEVSVLAASQATPALTGEARFVLVVATADPTATATVAAAQTNTELVSEGASGQARVVVVSNSASSSATLRLFDLGNESRLSTATTDERVLSGDQTVVRPTLVLADAVWAVQSDVATSAAGKSATAVASVASVASAYTYDACFVVDDHLDVLGDVNRAVVLYRGFNAAAWSARSTASRTDGSIEYLCADAQTEFGYFSLAATTEATPSPPALAFPDADRMGVAADPTFAWSAAIGADRYEFELSVDSSFSNPIANATTTGSYHAVSGLTVSTRHFWRARSGSALGFGPWSPVSAFTTSATGVQIAEDGSDDLPEAVSLAPNYPNPFRGRTTIVYQLPEADHVRLELFDLQGRLVSVLVDGEATAGEHNVSYDATGRAAGVYFIRLQTRGGTRVGRMVVL